MRVKKFSRTTSKKPMPIITGLRPADEAYAGSTKAVFGLMVMFLIAQILIMGVPGLFFATGACVLAFYALLWWMSRRAKKRTPKKVRVVAIISAVSMVVYGIALFVIWMHKHSGVRPQTTDTIMGYSQPPRVPAPSDIGDYTTAFPDV